jgi:transcriptional regulator with XRE-family HTH domain
MPKSQFTPAYAAFVKVLTAARKDAGVTQVELAERLGKPQPFVSSIENGVRRVDLIEFYAIARALKLDPEVLFGTVVRKLPKYVEI